MSDLRSEAVERAAQFIRFETMTLVALTEALHAGVRGDGIHRVPGLLAMIRDSVAAIERALTPPPSF